MEEQVIELKELLKTEDEQLKEIYDEMERDIKKDAQDLLLLRTEQKAIHSLLNSYGIPTMNNGRCLTIIERLDIALKKSA